MPRRVNEEDLRAIEGAVRAAPGRLDGTADRRRTTIRAPSPHPAISPEVARHQQAPCHGGHGALGSLPRTESDFPDGRRRWAIELWGRLTRVWAAQCAPAALVHSIPHHQAA